MKIEQELSTNLTVDECEVDEEDRADEPPVLREPDED